jgi:hypothetical protein
VERHRTVHRKRWTRSKGVVREVCHSRKQQRMVMEPVRVADGYGFDILAWMKQPHTAHHRNRGSQFTMLGLRLVSVASPKSPLDRQTARSTSEFCRLERRSPPFRAQLGRVDCGADANECQSEGQNEGQNEGRGLGAKKGELATQPRKSRASAEARNERDDAAGAVAMGSRSGMCYTPQPFPASPHPATPTV